MSYRPSNQDTPRPLTTPRLSDPESPARLRGRRPESLTACRVSTASCFVFRRCLCPQLLCLGLWSMGPVRGWWVHSVDVLRPWAPCPLVEELSREAGPNAEAGARPRSDSCSGLTAKSSKGAAGFPAHGALGQERAGVHPGLQGRWSSLSLKAWPGAAAPRFRPQTDAFYSSPS